LLDERRCLHHGAGASLPEAYRREIDGVAIGFGQGSCGTSAFLGRPVIASDVETNQHWINFKDLALEHDLRSCWSTPILAADGGAVLGTFAVYRSEIWEPDEAATRLVSRFTYLAAVAIGHHRLFNAVAESESRFRSAFEGATAGMALVGLDGSFLKVNPALCAMLDTKTVDLCQNNVLNFVEPAHQDQITDGWNEILPETSHTVGRERDPIEVLMVDQPGDDPLWVSMRSSLVSAENGEQPYFYIEIRDISASRRHAVEQRAREAAEAASQAKTDFLALVSHELRTPLNAILGFAQLMKLVQLDASQQSDSIENILKAGQHLLDLINELLDLSLIEARQFKTLLENVDASDAIDEALQILGPLADTRNIHLHRGLSANLSSTVATSLIDDLAHNFGEPAKERPVLHADRQCLRQVLINLVGNALKFTPAGGEVGVVTSEVADNTVRIRVLDSGPGIPAEEIEDLFQPFHRLAAEDRPEAEGTGLGLSVAARLAEEMQGSIGVESKLGVGSCFWVDLPAGIGPPSSALAQSFGQQQLTPVVLESRPTTGEILYVEDDPASVQVIAATLALRPSVKLMTAATAADTMAAIRSHNFDAILLDIGLPDGSGWDLLETLREQPETASIPVVVLTASSDVPPLGAPSPELIMVKPLDIGACLEIIDSLLTHPVR
jgi:PAS domain S-box-containing protein